MKGICCVVNGDCESPANLKPLHYIYTKCFSCGEYVCKKCSSKIRYYNYGIKRICLSCQDRYAN